MRLLSEIFIGVVAMLTALTTALSPAPVPQDPVHIGFIGCSMTRNTFSGWDRISNEVWPVDSGTGDYGGMSIGRWADDSKNSDAWADFESMMARFPNTDSVIIQVCGNKAGGSAQDHHIEAVAAELLNRHPSLDVYIGWQPEYVDGHDCRILSSIKTTTQESIARIRDVALHGIMLGLGDQDASPLGPLDASTTSDGCHANTAGEDLIGQQMESWWQGLDGDPDPEPEPAPTWSEIRLAIQAAGVDDTTPVSVIDLTGIETVTYDPTTETVTGR